MKILLDLIPGLINSAVKLKGAFQTKSSIKGIFAFLLLVVLVALGQHYVGEEAIEHAIDQAAEVVEQAEAVKGMLEQHDGQ